MFYWIMKHIVVGPILLAIFRPWVVGLENVPKEGAVVLASNHLSFIDSIFLPLVVDRRVVFLAKSEYFTGKGLKGWATRVFFQATGQLPIDRADLPSSTPRPSRRSGAHAGESTWITRLASMSFVFAP